VTRNAQLVPSSAWQSRVAREVMWMLVAHRGRPIHREILVDRLWPDDDPAKAANRLSVALTTIRKVLDPDRHNDSDHYVRTDRETTALIVENLALDVEIFLAEADRGLGLIRSGQHQRGVAVLRTAESRYVGDFLEEQPYADWAISLREEARAAYLAVGEALAQFDMTSGDHDSAARRYLRMLERDLYNEPAHLGLVSAMLATGRHGAARRLYGIYASRMAELEVEPASFPVIGSATPSRSSFPS
jgi:DNA-binding SARP family transcriptional activator